MDFIWMLLAFIIGACIVFLTLTLAFIWLTTGFINTGRLKGGLYVIVGKPGNGKSYLATDIAVMFLKAGRKVFTNFPVIYWNGKEFLCSCYFEKIMLLERNLTGAVIVNDEAHKDFWSRDFKTFAAEYKDFFSSCAQHEISYYSLTQHENRVDTIINDCANMFAVVEKTEIPFLEIPIYFTVNWFTSEKAMQSFEFNPAFSKPYYTEKVWFKKEIANAYQTKYFGTDSRPLYEGVSWSDKNKNEGKEYRGSDDFSRITIFVLAVQHNLNIIKDKIISCMPSRRKGVDIGERIDRSLEYESSNSDEGDSELESAVSIYESDQTEKERETK